MKKKFQYIIYTTFVIIWIITNNCLARTIAYNGWESFDNLSIEQQAIFFNSLDVDNKTKLLQDILIHYKVIQPPETNIKFYSNGNTFVAENFYYSKIMEMPTWEIINNKVYIYKNNKKSSFPSYDIEVWYNFSAEVRSFSSNPNYKLLNINYKSLCKNEYDGFFTCYKNWLYDFEEKQYQQKLKELNANKALKADKKQ